jgi:hypothetical protein
MIIPGKKALDNTSRLKTPPGGSRYVHEEERLGLHNENKYESIK